MSADCYVLRIFFCVSIIVTRILISLDLVFATFVLSESLAQTPFSEKHRINQNV